MGPAEYAVVVLVVGGRFLLPFTIPFYPLPGSIACMLLDSIDQSIFQQFPKIPLDGYQQYDKALDIYYLSIIYTATLRNWTNKRAFGMSRFLYYYRLFGDMLFELTGLRWLLFVFTNTFEYFFDFYEAVRLRWKPARMGKWTVILATAFIWIFIKLPQEWWIHIAKLDMTDFIKESIFGVSKDASWAEAVKANPAVVVIAAVVLAALVFVGWWIVTRKAPPADHHMHLKADPLPPELQGPELYGMVRASERLFDRALGEKIVLLAMVSVIFAQIMKGLEATNVGIAVFVAVFVIINAFVSHWLARRGRSWKSGAIEVAAMAAMNLGIVLVLEIATRVLGIVESRIPVGPTLAFVGLLTVLIVFFDRFHAVYRARQVLTR